MKYEVFARIDPGDDLLHVGRIDAETDRLARIHARTTFDEEDWDYMAVVRADDLLEVPTETPRPSPGGEDA